VGVDLGPVREADAPVAVAVLLLPGHDRPNTGVSVSAVCVSPTANLLIGPGGRVPRGATDTEKLPYGDLPPLCRRSSHSPGAGPGEVRRRRA
jgi:hypothetical protein